MAFIIKDRVKEGTTSTGTGDVSLGGSAATFDTFQSYMSNGDTTYYAIVHTTSGTDEWEVGLGTWNTGNTLTRTTVLAGSNGSSAVNFSAGTKDIFMTYPAAHAALAGDDVNFANITVTGTVDGRDVAADGTKLDTVEQNADVTDTVNVAAAGALMKSGGTMTGNLILNADPTTALGAATKEYVDTIAAAGIHYHTPVRVESPDSAGNLNATYDNGTSGVGATLTNAGTQAALVIDGVTLATNDRVLIYSQTNGYENGIYTVTNTGSASTNWVLTRATDCDSYGVSDPDAFGEGDAFFVKEGDTGAGELYVMNTSGPITFGTTAINFTVIAETAVYSAGTGMSLDGTTFSIGQDVGTTANVTFNQVTAAIIGNVTGNLTGDVTGNADTATALETARTIQISGDVTGSATFDGSANINITAAVQDDSHAHVISNVDGLQAALDAKADDTTTITAGNGLTGGGSLGANRTLNVGAGGGITVSADAVAHADTSSQASVDNSGNTFIQDVTLDTYGHVTGLTSSTVTVGDATITVTSGGGLTGSGDFTTNQGTNETITLSHADTSSQASVNNSGRTYIQDITLDTYGHITGITSATETVTNTNQLTTFQVEDGDGTEVTISHGKEWKFVEGGGVNIDWTDTDPGSDADPYDLTFTINTGVTAGSGLTGGGTLNANRTISHADTSSQASVNNSNGTVIQDVTLDGFGHVTSLASVNLDGRYYTETEADGRFVNVTGDTMTGDLTIDSSSTWNAGNGMLNVGGTGDGRIQVRHIWGKSSSSAGTDDLWLQYANNGNHVQIGQSGGGNNLYVAGELYAQGYFGGQRVFHDAYHPNADKWTTARTLTLTGDVTGSVSWDGSGNVSMSTAVGDAQTIDGYDSSRFFRRQTKTNATVGSGWMTVATCGSGRHSGEVIVTDADSGDHAYIRIHWMRSYQDSNFTVINCGGHANRITGARVLYQTSDNTYGTKLLQVYVTANSNYEVNVYELGDINDYGVPSAVTPVIENSKTGYALHGSELLNLETYGLSAEEGIQAASWVRAGSGFTIKDGPTLSEERDQNLKLFGASGGDVGITGYGSDGNWDFQLYGSGGQQGFLRSNWGAWSAYADTSGNWTGTASVRAPIFYDSDNTGYYTNQAGSSNLSVLTVNSALYYKEWIRNNGTGASGLYWHNSSNPGYAWHIYPESRNDMTFRTGLSNGGIKGTVSDTTARGYVHWTTSNEIGFLNNSRSWSLRVDSSGNSFHTSSARAPIFYDSNDTAYYVNPNAGSVLRGQVTIHDNGSSSPIVDIRNDDGGPWALRLYRDDLGGGTQVYLSNATTAYWQHTVQAGNDFRAPIFYDSNDTSYYTNPAGTSSMYEINVWNDVEFKNKGQGVTGTYDSYALQGVFNMGNAYKLSADGSGAGNLYGIAWSHPNAGTKGGANNLASHGMLILENGSFKGAWGGGRFVTPADIRGTIFYDYNNTSYYSDPSSTSRLNLVHENYLGIGTSPNSSGYRLNMGGSIDMNNYSIDYVDQLHFNDGVRFVGMDNDSYLKFRWNDTGAGGIRFYDGNDTHHGYIYGDGGGRFGLLDNDGAWAVHIGVSTEPLQLRCNNNPEFYVYDSYTYSPGSSRAPIFYDSNNTGYYVNPASTSVLNNLTVNGTVTGISATATNDIFWENGQTVSSNYTITNNKNAMSAGPITVNSGVTVTVGDGEAWTVV